MEDTTTASIYRLAPQSNQVTFPPSHVVIFQLEKMAGANTSFRQRALTEVLVKREIPASDIHAQLQRAHSDVCSATNSNRRQLKYFKDKHTHTRTHAHRASDG